MNTRTVIGKTLSVIGKIIRAILLTFAALLLLLMGYCMWNYSATESAGKAWCETIIAEYQADAETTIASYPSMTYGDILRLELQEGASGKLAESRPNFEIDAEGNYTCAYSAIGGLFPALYEYSSQTGEWVMYD